jgi:hypothetical protein
MPESYASGHERVGLESNIGDSADMIQRDSAKYWRQRIKGVCAGLEAIIGIIDERPCLQLRPLGQVSTIVSWQRQARRQKKRCRFAWLSCSFGRAVHRHVFARSLLQAIGLYRRRKRLLW